VAPMRCSGPRRRGPNRIPVSPPALALAVKRRRRTRLAGAEGRLVFNVGAETAKGRNIRYDARVAVCMQDDQPPFVRQREWPRNVVRRRHAGPAVGRAHRGRYMGKDRAVEYG
jgi:hypothetical protein